MRAIIIVDMQKDFSDFGSIVIKGANQVAQDIRTFLEKLDHNEWYFVFSRDFHPYNHMSFKYLPVHCVKQTIGAQYHDELIDIAKDLEIKKGTNKNYDSFSAFYKNKRKHSKLFKKLQKLNIKDVYVCGLMKEICVLHTANDAVSLGFNTYVIEDLTKSVDEHIFKEKINKDVKLIKRKDILN